MIIKDNKGDKSKSTTISGVFIFSFLTIVSIIVNLVTWVWVQEAEPEITYSCLAALAPFIVLYFAKRFKVFTVGPTGVEIHPREDHASKDST